jgi:hypothetical protein
MTIHKYSDLKLFLIINWLYSYYICVNYFGQVHVLFSFHLNFFLNHFIHHPLKKKFTINFGLNVFR